MLLKLVYIAGPYRAKTEAEVCENIAAARSAAIRIWRTGAVAVCPHLNTAFMGGVIPDNEFLRGDLELMARCDAVFAMPGHESSKGAANEVRVAKEQEMPVFTEFGRLSSWIREVSHPAR